MSKGGKPWKPLSRATLALLEQLQRRQGVRELEKRFLIVCEDTKSSKAYFDALTKHLGLSAASVVVAHSDGHTQPIQVVRKAVSLKKNAARPTSGTLPFDQVWCVIDGDYGDAIKPARFSSESHDIELAISTKCFEYWVVLHFEQYDKSALDCDAVCHYLKKEHLAQYTKGACDFRDIVKRYEAARQRARKLRRPGIGRRELPEDQNPCSEVYRLIDAILESKKPT